jgi:hypothetical protein
MKKEHVALVEPNYYSKFPPLGLLKLSTYEKNKGNTTELLRKDRFPSHKPDKVYITSLFTWAWKPVWEAVRKYQTRFPEVEITLGGLYASLLPEHARLSGVENIYSGLHPESEDLIPDYSLVPDWDGSIVFASRGCINTCANCVVPRLEGNISNEKISIKKYVMQYHKKIIFFDNNILAMGYWREIFDEILDLKKQVDFNQGLDARLVTNESAKLISKMRIPYIRLAYDGEDQKDSVKESIDLLSKYGVSKRSIFVYSMFNFTETPDEFFERCKQIINWGAVCYPMQFQPVNTLKKDAYVAPNWTSEKLNMVAAARRVIGFGGAFPPYKGLVKKFDNAPDFYEAFKLFPKDKPDSNELVKLDSYFKDTLP